MPDISRRDEREASRASAFSLSPRIFRQRCRLSRHIFLVSPFFHHAFARVRHGYLIRRPARASAPRFTPPAFCARLLTREAPPSATCAQDARTLTPFHVEARLLSPSA
jgi:hypothetical protein